MLLSYQILTSTPFLHQSRSLQHRSTEPYNQYLSRRLPGVPKHYQLLVLVLASTLTLFSILFFYHSEDFHRTFTSNRESTRSRQVRLLRQLFDRERIALLDGWDASVVERELRMPESALNPDVHAYVSRLSAFVNDYFEGSEHHAPMMASLRNIELGASTALQPQTGGFSKTIFSIDKGGRAGVPEVFELWEERLGPMGYTIEVADDDGMEAWIQRFTGAGSEKPWLDTIAMGGKQVTGSDRWADLWGNITLPVYKSDLLRYIVMLIEGGIYTDSDTAPLSPPDVWGSHAKQYYPPSLHALRRVMRELDLEDRVGVPSSDGGWRAAKGETETTTVDLLNPDELVPITSLGINNPDVAVVLSVEYDRSTQWRPNYARDLQITQWTLMGKPYHPIYIDAVATVVSNLRDMHNGLGVLDVTGPGPFTDAVLRYLLVQHGIKPDDLKGMTDGALIQDVLLLPSLAFGDYDRRTHFEWDVQDPSTRCVQHAFHGRWKQGSS